MAVSSYDDGVDAAAAAPRHRDTQDAATVLNDLLASMIPRTASCTSIHAADAPVVRRSSQGQGPSVPTNATPQQAQAGYERPTSKAQQAADDAEARRQGTGTREQPAAARGTPQKPKQPSSRVKSAPGWNSSTLSAAVSRQQSGDPGRTAAAAARRPLTGVPAAAAAGQSRRPGSNPVAKASAAASIRSAPHPAVLKQLSSPPAAAATAKGGGSVQAAFLRPYRRYVPSRTNRHAMMHTASPRVPGFQHSLAPKDTQASAAHTPHASEATSSSNDHGQGAGSKVSDAVEPLPGGEGQSEVGSRLSSSRWVWVRLMQGLG